MPLRKVVSFLIGRPWIVIGVVAAAGVAWWAAGTRDQEHEVRAAFSYAVNVVPGLDVQVNDIDVGKVTSVEYVDGQAIVGLGIDDERFWPLRRGTEATIRWGTTVGNGTRRIVLEPGPSSAPEIPEGGILGTDATHTPVELDEVLNTLDGRTRRRLQAMLASTSTALSGHADELNRGLRESAPALESVGGVMGDLVADEVALAGMVTNTHRVTRALAAKRAEISDLVTVAAATFDRFATNATELQATLDTAPAALGQARTTLARLDTSVDTLDALMADLRPGAARLRPLAAAARPALAELRRAVPPALASVRELRGAAAPVGALLERATPLVPQLSEVTGDLAPMVACVRPYTPEIIGFLSEWSSMPGNYDSVSHYARIFGIAHANAWGTEPKSARDLVERVPGVSYAMPRPPGYSVGQPWFIPECGVTPDALDPSKDPEQLEGSP